MSTSPEEMYGGHKPRVPGPEECSCPGCFKPVVWRPYPNRNVRLCQRHADRVLMASVLAALEEIVKEENL